METGQPDGSSAHGDLTRDAIVVFGSGAPALVASLVDQVSELFPALELYVVSEFPPTKGQWIPFHTGRSIKRNRERMNAALRLVRVRYAAILLDPSMPYRALRLLGLTVSPRILVFNENLNHFALHPRSAKAMLGHVKWRMRSHVRWQIHPGGDLYTLLWRLRHPRAFRRPAYYAAAQTAGWLLSLRRPWRVPVREDRAELPDGISVVIPTRNGRELLARLMPGLWQELNGMAGEVIVIDNGSEDGTAAWLQSQYPDAKVIVEPQPMSFAAAVNRGTDQARFAFVCTLNNDMVLRPGFFAPLRRAFDQVPDLFCATAQIFFPEGERRQETGKAVMPSRSEHHRDTSFPLRCDDPLEGEDGSYVLYGSGGCSLYRTAKFTALGGFDETFRPAYVEDLDLGFRAWQCGWPTVFVAGAQLVHAHQATTKRYFSREELETAVETNYLRFLARAVSDPALFQQLWGRAILRLNLSAAGHVPHEPAILALQRTRSLMSEPRPTVGEGWPERLILAAGSGDIAVFPGREPKGRPVVLVVSPYLPFPLSHGGAVRIYNLMRRAAEEFDQVLVCFADEWQAPARELTDLCQQVVLVRRHGSHVRRETERPDTVEEFDSEAFRAAVRLTVKQWRPAVAQLEFTQMAQYASDCAPAASLLVEHDITYDLFEQMLAQRDEWEVRNQYQRWRRFEQQAWPQMDRVVVMSPRDEQTVRQSGHARVVTLPNGVDIERFQPSSDLPEPNSVLFIGSFAHLPNLLALRFFLEEVWPRLAEYQPQLHIIAGHRHLFHLDRYEDRSRLRLDQPGIEVEGFVADVRPAYRRAAIVVAPLLASAGTNIKVLEAMAMGKAIVSTSAGVNGLDMTAGEHYLAASSASEWSATLSELFRNESLRQHLERQAREQACRVYDWDRIAERQAALYRELLKPNTHR